MFGIKGEHKFLVALTLLVNAVLFLWSAFFLAFWAPALGGCRYVATCPYSHLTTSTPIPVIDAIVGYTKLEIVLFAAIFILSLLSFYRLYLRKYDKMLLMVAINVILLVATLFMDTIVALD